MVDKTMVTVTVSPYIQRVTSTQRDPVRHCE